MSSEIDKVINPGDFIIVQRQKYTKLHKMKPHGNMTLGSFTIEMDNILGNKYWDVFQMKNKGKKIYTLEKTEDASAINSNLNIEQSGSDNRNIEADDNNQTLTSEEINRLKDEELNCNNIVEKLITNSKTFNEKTEYAQEKYIKKKSKKYFEYVQIKKPTIKLLTEMFYRFEPIKVLNLRVEELSQILAYSNIQSEGIHLLYDSGTSGLVPAALMHAIGPENDGKLIHMHPGNECQKTAIKAMQFPDEQEKRCLNVNLFSVLRHFHQNIPADLEETPPAKKQKIEEKKTPLWRLENEQACILLKKGVDSLVIVAKSHPIGLVDALEQFLLPSRNLVVFCLYQEPLQELYSHLKRKHYFLSIRIYSNWGRNYQILPERTHPNTNMTLGGYILSAVKISL